MRLLDKAASRVRQLAGIVESLSCMYTAGRATRCHETVVRRVERPLGDDDVERTSWNVLVSPLDDEDVVAAL